MQGIVEVYKNFGTENQEMILQEDNLLVDGASEQIAHMMTVSPSLSSVAGASSLLDTSNYTIQAISFGKGAASYKKNAHNNIFSGTILSEILGDLANPSATIIAVNTVSAHGGSSYTPESDLPSYPSPLDTQLEVSSESPGDVSAIDFSNGQNLNLVPSSYTHTLAAYATVHIYRQFYGCYPDTSTLGSKYKIVNGDGDTIVASSYYSLFNTVSSMDLRGFVGAVYDPGAKVGLEGSDPASGMVVSSCGDFSSTGEVAYITTIGSGDLGYSNLFGGIYNMGLWTMDNVAMLKNGKMAPYKFGVVDNPRTYKLFSKKSFTDNLCKISDVGNDQGAFNYQDLTIIWRIRF